jgi:hypothetical protein
VVWIVRSVGRNVGMQTLVGMRCLTMLDKSVRRGGYIMRLKVGYLSFSDVSQSSISTMISSKTEGVRGSNVARLCMWVMSLLTYAPGIVKLPSLFEKSPIL